MVSYLDRCLLLGIFVFCGVSQVLASIDAHHLKGPQKSDLQTHVKEELKVSKNYLALSAYFGKEDVNRPGLAKYFEESAERNFKRAQKIIDYLNKRGFALVVPDLKVEAPLKATWLDGVDALSHALEMEGRLTKRLNSIHHRGSEDGHLTNFLESEFLEDQVNTMRRLSGLYNNLNDMMSSDNPSRSKLAEYLFDRQLLRDEL